MSLLAAALLSFLTLRLVDAVVSPYIEVSTQVDFLLRTVWGVSAALAFLGLTGIGAPYLCLPAYGAALLFHRLDGLMLARADESIHQIMNRR